MIPKELSSLQHSLVKHCVKLREERAWRYRHKEVLLMGRVLVKEVASHTPLKILFIEKDTPIPSHFRAQETFIVSPSILKKITNLEHPEPIAAITALPEEAPLRDKKFLIALDGIADPGNLGTLLRSALALGWEGAFITEESCDPFNDKAIRAAKGATFSLPLFLGDHKRLEDLIAANQMHAYVADAKGNSLETLRIQPPLMLILGSEARGASDFVKTRYPSLSIPIAAETESLNVACAGSILMYTLKRRP